MVEQLAFRALLFDMDGTIVDSSAVVNRVWSDWAVSRGLDPAGVLADIHGRQSIASIRIHTPGASSEQHDADNQHIVNRESTELDGVVPILGAAELWNAVRDLPHALVTSATDRLAKARMGAAGLEFPIVAVTAERVANSKPAPDGFLEAARLLDVSPQDCIVFEDSPAGVEAARRAGMRTVIVGGTRAVRDNQWAVDDLRGISVANRDGSWHLEIAPA